MPSLLLVEDDRQIRTVLTRYLEPVADVQSVARADEALLRLEAVQVDIILTDEDLGAGGNGRRLLKEVALRWPHVRRFLMSGVPRATEETFLLKTDGLKKLASLVVPNL